MKRRTATVALLMLLAFGVAWWWHLGRIRQVAIEFELTPTEPPEEAMATEQEVVEPSLEIVPADAVEAVVPTRKYPYLDLETEALILQLESDYLNLLVRIGSDEVPYTDTIRHDIAAAFFEDVIGIITDHDLAVRYFRQGLEAVARPGIPLELLRHDFRSMPADAAAANFKQEIMDQSFLYSSTDAFRDETLERIEPLSEAKRALIEGELLPAVHAWLGDNKILALLMESSRSSEPYRTALSSSRMQNVVVITIRDIQGTIQGSWFGNHRIWIKGPNGDWVQGSMDERNYIYSDEAVVQNLGLNTEELVQEYHSTPVYDLLRQVVRSD